MSGEEDLEVLGDGKGVVLALPPVLFFTLARLFWNLLNLKFI